MKVRHYVLIDTLNVVPEPALSILSGWTVHMAVVVLRCQMKFEEFFDVG